MRYLNSRCKTLYATPRDELTELNKFRHFYLMQCIHVNIQLNKSFVDFMSANTNNMCSPIFGAPEIS